MKKNLLSLIVLMLFFGYSYGQNKTITGKVTGADDGLPMPAVSVKVAGTSIAVQTTGNGSYSIVVPPSATELEFSFLGYQLTVEKIAGRSVVNAALKPDPKSLNEVSACSSIVITRFRSSELCVNEECNVSSSSHRTVSQ